MTAMRAVVALGLGAGALLALTTWRRRRRQRCSAQQHFEMVRRCNELARESVSDGDQPFAAMLVLQGKVVATAKNTCSLRRDPTGHAETNLIRDLHTLRLTKDEVSNCVFYASTEPCLMCTGAILHGGVKHLVFGCSQGALSSCITGGKARYGSFCPEIVARFNPGVRVEGPVLEEEGRQVHSEFGWPAFLAGPGCGSWYSDRSEAK